MFTSEVQFGHAGACANAERETADAKNKALLAAGAYVPDSFDTLGTIIGSAINVLRNCYNLGLSWNNMLFAISVCVVITIASLAIE